MSSFRIDALEIAPSEYANLIGWQQFENHSKNGTIESNLFVFENARIYEKELNDKNWILKILEIFRKIAFWKSMNFIFLRLLEITFYT